MHRGAPEREVPSGTAVSDSFITVQLILGFLMRSLRHLWDLCFCWLGGFQRVGLPGSRYHIDHLYLGIKILAPLSQPVTGYAVELLPIEIIDHSDFSITLVKAGLKEEKKEGNWQRNLKSGHTGKCGVGCFQTLCGSVSGKKHSHFRRVKCWSLGKEETTTEYRCSAGSCQHCAEWSS